MGKANDKEPRATRDEDVDEEEDDFEDAAEEFEAGMKGLEDDEDDEGTGDVDSADDSPTRSSSVNHQFKIDKKTLKQNIQYTDDATLATDIKEVEAAIELFLNSEFVQAEKLLSQKYGKSLYYTLGFAVIRDLKALMTFDADDVTVAMDALKTTAEMANILRKKEPEKKGGMFSSLTGMVSGVAGSLLGKGSTKEGGHMRSMSRTQRHAELCYAEAYLLRAILSLVHGANIVAFVKEGLAIRHSYATMKGCYRFVEKVYEEEGTAGFDRVGIDEHFVSGVCLTMGAFNLILSMLPGKVLKLFEMIGFTGDRKFALDRLETGARWPEMPMPMRGGPGGLGGIASSTTATQLQKNNSRKSKEFVLFPMPKATSTSGGVRKFLCDLTLMGYHVMLSHMIPLPDADLPRARTMLTNTLRERPKSFIFLALRARLLMTEGKPREAEKEFDKVLGINKDWRQLVHACIWDMSLCRASLGSWKAAAEGLATLYDESKWSKATYRYMQAVFLYADDPVGNKDRVTELLKEVPSLGKKIAGKSIPMEKFVARKARKYALQNNRLLLPGHEMLYFWNGFPTMPRQVLLSFIKQIDDIMADLDKQLQAHRANQQNSSDDDANVPYETFYDDLCLAKFLKANAQRELGHPHSETLVPAKEMLIKAQKVHELLKSSQTQTESSAAASSEPTMSSQTDLSSDAKLTPAERAAYLSAAMRDLDFIQRHAGGIKLDHWILPYSRMELGMLSMHCGKFEKAKKEFEAALKGGVLDGENKDKDTKGGDAEKGNGGVAGVSGAGEGVTGEGEGVPNGPGAAVKGKKASMENALLIKTHNALVVLKAMERAAEDMGVKF
ncbi:hypothetical protein HK102_004071 [Quaeritorhiza haematococci]|nr:hypothetical protein HK102_004071 [Quaeritorhiza haematococci]